MEESSVDIDLMFITNHQSSEVTDPGDAAFHFPASFISPQFSPILRRRLFPVGFMRTDQVNASLLQSFSQWIGVCGLVIDQPHRILAWPAATPGHRYLLQRRFDQRRLMRGRTG